MSLIETMYASYEFNRSRTLATLDRIEEISANQTAGNEITEAEVLGWRPADGRAHVAWQLMHIAITEDIFASERLAPSKSGLFQDIWERFRGGSQPDDQVPGLSEIRKVLAESRQSLVETLNDLKDADLDVVPEGLAERGWTLRTVLQIISWHESHHQGQAHLTLNLFENR